MHNLLGNSKSPLAMWPTIAMLVALLVLGMAIRRPNFNLKIPWLNQSAGESLTASADGAAWTAVYLDSNQVFYGKVVADLDNWLVLTNVFTYNPASQPAGRQSVRVTKVGTELHQPLDRAHLNREHIVMTQTLPAESKVVKAIEAYQPQEGNE